MITRPENQSAPDFEAMRRRADEQAQACRDEQNRLNASRAAADRTNAPDIEARKLLNRMRRKPNEIDPEGRWR